MTALHIASTAFFAAVLVGSLYSGFRSVRAALRERAA